MNLRIAASIAGIINAAIYARTDNPKWPLTIALATLSGFNLATAINDYKERAA